MSTVDKQIADDIVAGKYPEDQATRIVEYDNAFGGIGYGVTFGDEPKDRYMEETPFIRNPRIYWDNVTGKAESQVNAEPDIGKMVDDFIDGMINQASHVGVAQRADKTKEIIEDEIAKIKVSHGFAIGEFVDETVSIMLLGNGLTMVFTENPFDKLMGGKMLVSLLARNTALARRLYGIPQETVETYMDMAWAITDKVMNEGIRASEGATLQ